MHSSAQFILKSPIITFCSEERWPRIVRRPESKRGIGTWGERYSAIIVKSGCLSVLMIVNSIPSMLCANGIRLSKGSDCTQLFYHMDVLIQMNLSCHFKIACNH